MNLESRIARLEQSKHRANESQIVRINGERIDRDAGEPLPDFEARAITSAKASHVNCVVIGGLPD